MSEVGRLQREIQVLRADLLALAARLERLEGDLADLQSEGRPGSSVLGILGSGLSGPEGRLGLRLQPGAA